MLGLRSSPFSPVSPSISADETERVENVAASLTRNAGFWTSTNAWFRAMCDGNALFLQKRRRAHVRSEKGSPVKELSVGVLL